MVADLTNLISNLLVFVESYSDSNNTLSDTCFNELKKLIIGYMDCQGELETAKENFRGLKKNLNEVLKDSEMDPTVMIRIINDLVSDPNKRVETDKSHDLHKSKLREAEEQIEFFKEQSKELKKELEQMRKTNFDVEMKFEKADQEVELLTKQIQTLQDENLTLLDQLQDLQTESRRQSEVLIEELEEVREKTKSQTNSITRSVETLEMRLSLEKNDNQKLQLQVEELREQVREFEGKVANLNIEIAKRSQKITQATTTTSILQTQVERLRLEMEEEKLASEREISHLNALISEKNSLVEKYKSELGIEKDQKGDSEFGQETTANFDSIFENDFESLFDSNSSNFKLEAFSHPSEDARDPHLSPRALIASEARLNPDQLCSQMAVFLKKKTEDPASDLLKSPKIATLDKATQTKEEAPKDPPAPLISLPQDKKTICELTEDNKALSDKFRAATEELAEKAKLIDLYKSRIQQREATIDALTEKLVRVSEENSQTINDINSEYMSLLQKYMLLKKN